MTKEAGAIVSQLDARVSRPLGEKSAPALVSELALGYALCGKGEAADACFDEACRMVLTERNAQVLWAIVVHLARSGRSERALKLAESIAYVNVVQAATPQVALIRLSEGTAGGDPIETLREHWKLVQDFDWSRGVAFADYDLRTEQFVLIFRTCLELAGKAPGDDHAEPFFTLADELAGALENRRAQLEAWLRLGRLSAQKGRYVLARRSFRKAEERASQWYRRRSRAEILAWIAARELLSWDAVLKGRGAGSDSGQTETLRWWKAQAQQRMFEQFLIGADDLHRTLSLCAPLAAAFPAQAVGIAKEVLASRVT